MALVSGRLTAGKPLVEITLADATPAPSQLAAQTDPPSLSVRQYKALLDSGADITCLCDHVVNECRLRPYGFERMIGALGPSLHQTYIVRIGILCGDQEDPSAADRGLFQLEPLEAAVIRDNHWFDLIIGTDVLSAHEFTLTRGGGFKLQLF